MRRGPIVSIRSLDLAAPLEEHQHEGVRRAVDAATRRIEHLRRVPGQPAWVVLARPVAQLGWDARCDFRPLRYGLVIASARTTLRHFLPLQLAIPRLEEGYFIL